MKNKILNICNSNIKINISGKNINNFIKRIIKNNINIIWYNRVSYKEAELIIKYSDLESIYKYKSIYDIKVIRYYGILHLFRYIKKNKYIISFLILGFIIIYILSNIIFSIEVIHSNNNIVKLVTNELQNNGIKKYSYKKSYLELEKIEKKILDNNKDNLEWLEIKRIGTKYIVRVEERILNKKNNSNVKYNIVSSKNAIIKNIEASMGEKVRDNNTYVRKGELVISPYITLPNNTSILKGAEGTVIGEVWYTVDIEYPLYYHEVLYTGKKKKVLVFNYINKRISFFDFNKYKSFDKNTKVIFKNNIIPISLNYEYQYETNIIDEIYDVDTAREKAITLAEKKLKEKYSSIKDVSNVKIIYEESDDKKISLNLFITVLEDITKYEEVIIE